MKDLKSTINVPWIILGDFNVTKKPSECQEKSSGIIASREFNNFINELKLIEFNHQNWLFTWSNFWETTSLVRLKQSIISVAWHQALPFTSCSTLTRTTSDHVPSVITYSPQDQQSNLAPRPFRFEEYWHHYLDFDTIVKDCLK